MAFMCQKVTKSTYLIPATMQMKLNQSESPMMPLMRQVVNQGPGKTKSYISASQYHFGDEDNQTRLMEHESWREAPNPEGDGSCMREEDGPNRVPRRANDDRPIQMGPGMNTT